MTEDAARAINVFRAARWLARALKDLANGHDLAARGEGELAVFCFQQAAEKALKAVLIDAQVGFERTHNLAALLVPVARLEAGFLDCPGELDRVSGHATRFRYPVDGGPDYASDEEVAAGRLVADWLVARAEARLAGPVADLARQILAGRDPG